MAIANKKTHSDVVTVPQNFNKRTLEYFDSFKLKKEKRELINKMLHSSNPDDVEWARVYEIDDHYVAKRISSVQALEAYSDLKPNNRDVAIGLRLFKSYIFAEEQAFGLMDEYTMGLDYAIDSLSDDYMRNMYKARYSVLNVTGLVAKDYIKEAKQVCIEMMNSNLDDYYTSLIALQLGNTYMLDDPNRGIEIYNKGLSLATESRSEVIQGNLQNSYDFTCITAGREPKYLNFESINPSDIHNIAFWKIKTGNIQEGENLLNSIEWDSLNDLQKAFHHYYRGFIREPLKHFSQALRHFKISGEFFFRKLALHELKKLGLDENVIEALSV